MKCPDHSTDQSNLYDDKISPRCRISAFTITRNAIKFNYPVIESIQSILPICDEFVINVGASDDDTLVLIRSIKSPKVRIIHSKWDESMGKEMLSFETNRALKACRGKWAFYLQNDEVIHEKDLPKLRSIFDQLDDSNEIDSVRFRWFHFYGSYYRYRIDRGWYQKQDRIIRNNGEIESEGDAWGFRRCDQRPLQRIHSGCSIYHYGWVQNDDVMAQRRHNAAQIGFVRLTDKEKESRYQFGRLSRFPIYFGRHPRVMQSLVAAHEISRNDWQKIVRRFFWSPWLWFRSRQKTWRRERKTLS